MSAPYRSPSLLQILTKRILRGKITVEEARQIVLNHEYFKRPKPVNTVSFEPPGLQEIEEDAIREAFKRAGNNVRAAAQILKIPRTTLYRKLKVLGEL